VTDWIDTEDHGDDEYEPRDLFDDIVDDRIYEPADELAPRRSARHDGTWSTSRFASTNVDPNAIPESWSEINLAAVLAGDHTQPTPTVGHTIDGSRALSYRGAVNGMHADSGNGKGWVALLKAKQQLEMSNHVAFIDYEDNEASIVARLRILGVTVDAIRSRFHYFRPRDEWTAAVTRHLVEMVNDTRTTYVVIDSTGEAFATEGINEDRDNEVGPWMAMNARPLADTEAAPAVDLIDHSTKANDNPLHPSGSKRKRAAISGASYFVKVRRPLVKGKGGELGLVCAKDRHGNYARGEEVARFVMTYPNPDDLTYAEAGFVLGSTKPRPVASGSLDEHEQRTLESLTALGGMAPPSKVKDKARRKGTKNLPEITRPDIDAALEQLSERGLVEQDSDTVRITDAGRQALDPTP
jgi:hypothetical protein